MIYFDKKIISVIPKIISGFLIVAFVAVSVISSASFIFAPAKAEAAFNKQINYQGKLTNSSNVPVADGTYQMMFRLYTVATGGSPIFTEDRSTAVGDRITVSNGLFSVMLGSSTPLTSVDFNQTLYLGVEVQADGEMAPRKVLGAVPAAFTADNVDGLSSEQFLRSDAVNATSTASTFLTITQNGAGKIAEFIGASSAPVLNLFSGGNVSVGTSTPYGRFSVWGAGTGTGILANFVNSASTTLFSILENGTISTPGLTLTGNESIGHILTTEGSFEANFASGVVINGETSSGRGPRMHLGNGSYGWTMTYADFSTTLADPSLLAGQDGSGVTGGAVQINAGHGLLDDNGGALTLNAGRSDGAGNGGDVTISSGSVGGISGTGGDIILELGFAPTVGSILLQGGNVGIGTTSPYAKLSVAGQTVAAYFTATTTTASTFPYASTTALTVSGTNGLQLAAALNGPLQAVNGLVSATSTLSIAYGGTGISTAPTYGQLLMGNGSGSYSLTSTSSLGITSSQWVTSGNNIYNSNTANVGIGTTTPYSKLSVWSGDAASTTIAEFVNSASSTIFSVTGNGQLNLRGTPSAPNFRIYNNNTDTYLGGLAVNGGSTRITGNPNVGDATAGSVFIYGALGTYGELEQNSGATYIGTSVVSRPNTGAVIGGTPDQNFLGVGGMMTVIGYAQFNSNIIVGGASANPTAAGESTISLQGQAARSIGMERNWTAATVGQALTVNAGGARLSGTNLNGGNLLLRSGVSTGTGVSTLTLGTYGGGSSGTSDGTMTSSLVLAHNQATFAHGMSVAVGTTTPWGRLSVGTHNLAITTPSFVIASSSTGVATTTQFVVTNGFVGIGLASPTARLQLAGGSATANTSPLKFTSGTNMTAAEAGAVEYDGTQLYFTPSATRNILAQVSGGTAITAGYVPYATANGYLTSSANFAFNGTQLSLGGAIPLETLNILGNTVFDSTADRTIYIGSAASNSNGKNLNIAGGAAGTSPDTDFNGGSVYIYGGDKTQNGSYGNVILGHNGTISLGNVGIGTTSPYAKLSVDGRGVFNQDVRANYFTATSTTVASTFPYASTTALTVSGTNGLQLAAALNGPLQAVNGLVSATSTLSIAYGGTGVSTAPAYGQILVGNGTGGYTLTATSSLGIAVGSSQWTTAGSDIHYTTGNVGVGTTTPWAKLSVSTTAGQDGGLPLFTVASTTNTNLFTVFGNGNVGVGTTTVSSSFAVQSNTAEDTALSLTGNINSYYQGNIRNTSGGASASSDWVATANNGSETTHYVDMGINGSGGGGAPFTTANHAYLYSIDDTLNIGALGASSEIIFHTTGGTSPVERARISSTGNFGVGTTSPWAQFSVNPNGVTGPAFAVGSSTATHLMVSNGGLVGIGTTSPYAKFSLSGVAGAAVANTLFSIATTTSAGVSTNIFKIDGTGNITIGQAGRAGVGMRFETSSSSSFFGTVGYGYDTNNGAYVGMTSTNIDVQLVSGARSFWIAAGGSRDSGINMQVTSVFSAASARMLVIANRNGSASGNATGISLDSTWTTGAGTAHDSDILINRVETSLATAGMHSFLRGQVSGADRFWVTNLGGAYFKDNVGVGGTSTPWAKLVVGTHNLAVTTPSFMVASSSTGVATSTQFVVINNKVGVASSTPWRTFSVDGTVALNGLTANTGNAVCITAGKDITDAGGTSCVPSSIRFKENVETLAEGFALDKLNQLRVVSFDYKNGFYSPEDRKESYGMIAEEVEEIDPNLVDYGYDGQPATLKFEKILGLTVQAVQELQHNFRLTGGPDGSVGELAMQSILRSLKNLGVDIRDGIAYVKNLVVESLTVGSTEKPAGITLFDEKTGKPFCVKVSGGKLKNIPGTCENLESEDEDENEGGGGGGIDLPTDQVSGGAPIDAGSVIQIPDTGSVTEGSGNDSNSDTLMDGGSEGGQDEGGEGDDDSGSNENSESEASIIQVDRVL